MDGLSASNRPGATEHLAKPRGILFGEKTLQHAAPSSYSSNMPYSILLIFHRTAPKRPRTTSPQVVDPGDWAWGAGRGEIAVSIVSPELVTLPNWAEANDGEMEVWSDEAGEEANIWSVFFASVRVANGGVRSKVIHVPKQMDGIGCIHAKSFPRGQTQAGREEACGIGGECFAHAGRWNHDARVLSKEFALGDVAPREERLSKDGVGILYGKSLRYDSPLEL